MSAQCNTQMMRHRIVHLKQIMLSTNVTPINVINKRSVNAGSGLPERGGLKGKSTNWAEHDRSAGGPSSEPRLAQRCGGPGGRLPSPATFGDESPSPSVTVQEQPKQLTRNALGPPNMNCSFGSDKTHACPLVL